MKKQNASKVKKMWIDMVKKRIEEWSEEEKSLLHYFIVGALSPSIDRLWNEGECRNRVS